MWLANKGQQRRLQQAPIRLEHGDRQGGGPEHPKRGLQRWGKSKYSEYSWEVIRSVILKILLPFFHSLLRTWNRLAFTQANQIKQTNKKFTLTV